MTIASEPVLKDEHAQRPVASAWRPTLREIVRALANKDYSLARSSIAGVERIPPEKAKRIEAYIAGYGETVVELPDDAWKSSASQWMGTHWDILVDLYTAEGSPSDLALSVRVFEDAGGYRYEVDSVHVP